MKRALYLIIVLPLLIGCNTSKEMPDRGICAHRGAMDTHPENTLSAFIEAMRLGVHMIEFDVRITKDGHLVILHDETIDRTTNGKGKISELTIDEVKKLDAGSWKSEKFANERIPTLKETLDLMPENIWLNVHIKGGEKSGEMVARIILDENRMHQAFLACGSDAANGAKKISQDIMICNMERQDDRDGYMKETIRQKSHFIQLLRNRTDQYLEKEIAVLRKHHIRINYCCTDSSDEVKTLFESGVDFILTNRVSDMLEVAEIMGIKPLQYNKKNSNTSYKQVLDGIIYSLITTLNIPGKPNETTLRFTSDNKMIPARITHAGDLTKLVTLPSGGDCSYPGMVIKDNILYVSYYSTHEGKTVIYFT